MLHFLWSYIGANLIPAAGIAAGSLNQPRQQHQYRMVEGEAQLRRQLIEQEAGHQYRMVEGEAAMGRQIIEQQVANELLKCCPKIIPGS
jgi:hypothetical protein